MVKIKYGKYLGIDKRFGMWTANAAEKEGVGNEYAVKIVSNSWT